MGDGRYYTILQFNNVLFLTIVIMAFVVVFMNNIFKIDKYKKFFFFTGIEVFAILFLSFISELIVDVSLVGDLIFSAYLIAFIYSISVLFFYIYYGFTNKMTLYLLLQLVLLVFSIFVINTFLRNVVSVYLLFAINYAFNTYYFIEYKVSVNVFNNIRHLVGDYVFIIVDDGRVAYLNDGAKKSSFFKDLKKLDINHLEEVFNSKVNYNKQYFKKLIEYESEDGNRLFQYQIKNIINNKRIAGYIITFVDVTDLIGILDKIEESREELFKSNMKLIKYKEKVYEIERAKEINHLLKEIANNQHILMKKLKRDIAEISLDDDNAEEEIDRLLNLSKTDLKNVRETVNTYVNY